MTAQEYQLVRDALATLHRIIPDDHIYAVNTAPRRCPVQAFAKRWVKLDPNSDMSVAELWEFYAEIAAAGKAEPISRSVFQRSLPGAMMAVFGARKSHAIRRDAKTLRGFRGITISDTHDEPVWQIDGH